MRHPAHIPGLAQTLAEEYILALKTQNYHWNVEGPLFYSFHKLFEEQYTFLSEQVDNIAERIRAHGEKAPGSFQEFLKISKVQEAGTDKVPAARMVEELYQDHEAIFARIQEFRNQADRGGDQTTVNLYDDLLDFHQKAAWMLRSSRG